MVVESAEGARDVGALSLLDLEHQLAHVGGHRVHTQGVESALQHMGLNPGFMERGRPHADGLVGILAVEEIDLLESAAVGLHPVETPHIDDGGSDPHKLVSAGLVFARRLPHISVN